MSNMLNSSNTNINIGTNPNANSNLPIQGQQQQAPTTPTNTTNLDPGFLFKQTFQNTVNTGHEFSNINTSLEKPVLTAKLDSGSSLLMDINFESVGNDASVGGGARLSKASPKKTAKKRKKEDEAENGEKKKAKASNQRRNIK